MSIIIDLPAGIEEQLRRDLVNLDAVAKEAALVALYRQGRITHHQLAVSLNLSRIEIEELLKRHNVVDDLATAAQVGDDISTLRRLLGR